MKREKNSASAADVRRAKNFSNENEFIRDFRPTGRSMNRSESEEEEKMMLVFTFRIFLVDRKSFIRLKNVSIKRGGKGRIVKRLLSKVNVARPFVFVFASFSQSVSL